MAESAAPPEEVEGFETCLVVPVIPGAVAERRFLASATRPVPAGRVVEEAGRVVGAAPVDILLEVLVLGGMLLVLVVVVGLLVVEAVEEAAAGVLVVLEGEVVPELGTADCRRVVDVTPGFRLSSSETEG